MYVNMLCRPKKERSRTLVGAGLKTSSALFYHLFYYAYSLFLVFAMITKDSGNDILGE